MQMCKCSLFDPNRVKEINFNFGRHRVDPIGTIVAPHVDELLNLHYKYLGFEILQRDIANSEAVWVRRMKLPGGDTNIDGQTRSYARTGARWRKD